MDKRKLITRIALVISVAALAFSLVTLGRSIVLAGGIVPSLLLVFTTGIVVVVCYLMLRAYSNYDEEYDDHYEPEDDSEPAEATPSRRRTERPAGPEAEAEPMPLRKAKRSADSEREPEPQRKIKLAPELSFRAKRSHDPEPQPEPSVIDAEQLPEPQPELSEPSASPEHIEPAEPFSDDISQQVDALISELEMDASYDLSNFE